MTETSLRERSKVRRRRTILTMAMRLFAERGYDATTVSDIAAAVDVSPRTVSLYFPTKLEIAQASMTDAVGRLVDDLEHRQALTMADTVLEWLRDEPQHVDTEEWDLRARMYVANPALMNMGNGQGDKLGEISAHVLADELDAPVDHLAVGLSGGAIAGVLTQYMLLTRHADQTTQSLQLVHGLVQGVIDGARRTIATHTT